MKVDDLTYGKEKGLTKMYTDRINRVLDLMKEKDLTQMIVSNRYSIFWMTGVMIEPGERLYALYLNINGSHKAFVNNLFKTDADFDMDKIFYDDTEDPIKMISDVTDHTKPLGIDKNWPSGFLIRLIDLNGASKYVDGSDIVDFCRQVKDEKEQELMRISSRLNDMAMERLVKLVGQGYSEEELVVMLKDIYKELGCDGISFEPIITFGKGAATPHHVTDGTKGKKGDCVVMDIGAYKDGYASDMTRTVFLGEVSDRHRLIYETVAEANRRGIAAAKPGNKMSDVDKACRDYITEKGFGQYFTHRTGHGIGLEEHEAGDVSSANDAIIRVGQCFSVEPGIYIPEENIGVRVEDLVIVQEDGAELLNHYPKEIVLI